MALSANGPALPALCFMQDERVCTPKPAPLSSVQIHSPLQRHVAVGHGDHGQLKLVRARGERQEQGEHIVDTWSFACQCEARAGGRRGRGLPGSVSMIMRFLGAMGAKKGGMVKVKETVCEVSGKAERGEHGILMGNESGHAHERTAAPDVAGQFSRRRWTMLLMARQLGGYLPEYKCAGSINYVSFGRTGAIQLWKWSR